MTRALLEGVGELRLSGVGQALNFVAGTLIAYDAAAGKDPYGGLDVERVFAAVELLAERRTLEVSPFVAAWHPAVDHWDRSPEAPFFDSDFRRALLAPHPVPHQLKTMIADVIDARTGQGDGRVYRLLAMNMVQVLRGLVATTAKDVGYLKPLVRAERQPLTIATLNYDLSIELAAEAQSVPLSTGVERWSEDGAWRWRDGEVRLLKLHGSIDWCWEHVGGEGGTLPHQRLITTEDPGGEPRRPAVVFGSRDKLQAEGPFLALLREFESALGATDRLLVVGYSFRDAHINAVLRRWLAEDVQRTLTVIDPAFPLSPEAGIGEFSFRDQLIEYLVPWRGPGADWPKRLHVRRVGAATGLASLMFTD